ncbi:hypothetical protein SLEP1_g27750 [Rubroshorea leprosula]|uniref:Uncharacterized protein n=1 Tax=Rubroshorea leprosula TaxID=152421 RepID=A0AAV5K264_9ROSI|nr:hypothetical protein SLEP1_g27750 [Rubroshorea leprosula]
MLSGYFHNCSKIIGLLRTSRKIIGRINRIISLFQISCCR